MKNFRQSDNCPIQHPYFLVTLLLVTGTFLLAPAARASLTLMDFDHVAFKWDSGESATATATGVYFARLSATGHLGTQKLVLTK